MRLFRIGLFILAVNMLIFPVSAKSSGNYAPCGVPDFNQTQNIYYTGFATNTIPVEVCMVDRGLLTVDQALAIPQGLIPDGILNWNFRSRHTGDDEVLIRAEIINSGAGISKVEVDLSSIGGGIVEMDHMGGGWYEHRAKATDGINAFHSFTITAEDEDTDKATGTTNAIFVFSRGDVDQDNVLNILDAYKIGLYTVELYTPLDPDLFDFLGDVQPACDGDYLTNIGDALYIARYSVGLEMPP